MQTAHGADVVVAEEAHDQVALAQQVAPLLWGHLGLLPYGAQQKLLQFQHFGDIPPVEHAAHQHKERQRMRFQGVNGTLRNGVKYRLWVQRGKQNACVLFHNTQQGVVIPAFPIGGQGLYVLLMLLIPCAETFTAAHLLLFRQCQEGALGTLLHHVVKAIGHAVRQAGYEGVLGGQHRQQFFRVSVLGDKTGHLHSEFIGKTHDCQKFPLLFRQRVDHGGGEGGVNVGVTVGQRTALGKRPKIQIDSRKPALTGIEQRIHLCIGEADSAAVGINGKLRVVQPQLLRADLIYPVSQPDDLRSGQETIPAGNDQMHIAGQAVCKGAEKTRDAIVRQQVEIVDEQVAGGFPRQLTAEIVCQQSPSGSIRGTGVVPQEVKARPGKSVLHTLPEDGEVVGVHADTDDLRRFCSGSLFQIPVYRRGLAVAHGRDHRSQGTAGDGPQTLLQALGYVDGVQIPFLFWHGVHLRLILLAGRTAFSHPQELPRSARSVLLPERTPAIYTD